MKKLTLLGSWLTDSQNFAFEISFSETFFEESEEKHVKCNICYEKTLYNKILAFQVACKALSRYRAS